MTLRKKYWLSRLLIGSVSRRWLGKAWLAIVVWLAIAISIRRALRLPRKRDAEIESGQVQPIGHAEFLRRTSGVSGMRVEYHPLTVSDLNSAVALRLAGAASLAHEPRNLARKFFSLARRAPSLAAKPRNLVSKAFCLARRTPSLACKPREPRGRSVGLCPRGFPPRPPSSSPPRPACRAPRAGRGVPPPTSRGRQGGVNLRPRQSPARHLPAPPCAARSRISR